MDDEALAYIGERRLLAEALRHERLRIEQIVDVALLHTDPDTHWKEYERLKVWANEIVGDGARRSELRSEGHYRVMVEFINWLLYQNEPREIEAWREGRFCEDLGSYERRWRNR